MLSNIVYCQCRSACIWKRLCLFKRRYPGTEPWHGGWRIPVCPWCQSVCHVTWRDLGPVSWHCHCDSPGQPDSVARVARQPAPVYSFLCPAPVSKVAPTKLNTHCYAKQFKECKTVCFPLKQKKLKLTLLTSILLLRLWLNTFWTWLEKSTFSRNLLRRTLAI